MNKTTISLSILATMLCALIIFTSTSFVPASNGNGNGDNFGYDIFTTASQETTTKKTEPTTKKTKPSTKSLTIGRTKINKVTVKKTTVTASLKKIKNVDAVSYTHLDVYKRQMYILQRSSILPLLELWLTNGLCV